MCADLSPVLLSPSDSPQNLSRYHDRSVGSPSLGHFMEMTAGSSLHIILVECSVMVLTLAMLSDAA